MRDILFKGKRTDNEEWVFGYPVRRPSACCIGQPSSWAIIVSPKDPDDNGGEYWVDKETIGQYVQITDKNDVKVFEWDRIRCQTLSSEKEGYVAYVPGTYYLASNDGDEPLVNCHKIEVIGNIYDD